MATTRIGLGPFLFSDQYSNYDSTGDCMMYTTFRELLVSLWLLVWVFCSPSQVLPAYGCIQTLPDITRFEFNTISDTRNFGKGKKNGILTFDTRPKFFLAGVIEKWDEDGRRVLLGDNTGLGGVGVGGSHAAAFWVPVCWSLDFGWTPETFVALGKMLV